MNARFDQRRRELRGQLHELRVAVRNHSTERLMAEALVLDDTLLSEFGSLPYESLWCYDTGGGEKAANVAAERFKAVGVYVGLGEAK